MASGYRQDMPPKGGYDPINWARIGIQKKPIAGWKMLAFLGITTVWGTWYYGFHWRRRMMREEREMMDGRLAVEPFMLAERDRALLKHYRQNRDEENELMKDVPGWVTGTWYGEPVFHNPSDRFPAPCMWEVFSHTNRGYISGRGLKGN